MRSSNAAATTSPWLTNPGAGAPSVGPESPYRLAAITKLSLEEQLGFYETLLKKRCDNNFTSEELQGLHSLMAEITADPLIAQNPLSAIAKVFPALENYVDDINNALGNAIALMESMANKNNFEFTKTSVKRLIEKADKGTYDDGFNFEKFTLVQNYLRAGLLSHLIFGDAKGEHAFFFQNEIQGDEGGKRPDYINNLMKRFSYQQPAQSWSDLSSKPTP